MIRYLIFIILLFGSIFFIVYQLAQFFLGSRSLKRIIERDLEFLKVQLKELKDGLVPIDAEELKILSANPVMKNLRKGATGFSKGVLSTIYQEPIFAYALKRYKTEGQLLMLVTTSEAEYRYLYADQKTKVFINGDQVGTISNENKLMSTDGRKKIAELIEKPFEKVNVIKKGEDELAYLNRKDADLSQSNLDRAFSLFHTFRKNVEEEVVLMTLHEILFKPNLK